MNRGGYARKKERGRPRLNEEVVDKTVSAWRQDIKNIIIVGDTLASVSHHLAGHGWLRPSSRRYYRYKSILILSVPCEISTSIGSISGKSRADTYLWAPAFHWQLNGHHCCASVGWRVDRNIARWLLFPLLSTDSKTCVHICLSINSVSQE